LGSGSARGTGGIGGERTHRSLPGTRYLLWCFKWPLRWWERLVFRFAFFGAMALDPGEAERRFGEYFEIERIAGDTNLSGSLGVGVGSEPESPTCWGCGVATPNELGTPTL